MDIGSAILCVYGPNREIHVHRKAPLAVEERWQVLVDIEYSGRLEVDPLLICVQVVVSRICANFSHVTDLVLNFGNLAQIPVPRSVDAFQTLKE